MTIEEAKQSKWWLTLPEIYLNIGGGNIRHGVENYDNYISVNHPKWKSNRPMFEGRYTDEIIDYEQNMKIDLNTGMVIETKSSNLIEQSIPYDVAHDICKPFPLDDNSIARISASHVLEHIEEYYWPSILAELYRILRPIGLLRVDVPDYNNPKFDGFEIELGFDPADASHLVMTTYKLMKRYTDNCPFEIVEYKHYWEDNKFIKNEIDYSLGWVVRTPDNDERDSPFSHSLVVDLIKEPELWLARSRFHQN